MSEPMTQQEFTDAYGEQCPTCRGTKITPGDAEFDSGWCGYAHFTCDDCGARWTASYGPTGYQFDDLEDECLDP